MRCPYCHNSELVLNPPASMLIPEDEVMAHLSKRRNVLTGLCITGGEPTLQPDLRDFIIKVRELGYRIKLDTNGLRPDVLKLLLDEKLLEILTERAEPVKAVTESLGLLIGSGIEYELRTTVVKGLHGEEDFADIRDWISDIISRQHSSGIPHYYLQSYVERETVMDRSCGFAGFSKEELERFADILSPIAEDISIRGVD